MNKFPSWFTITDWEAITPEKARFVYEQATLCYADQLDGYSALKLRCELLFVLSISILIGLIAFATSVLSKDTLNWLVIVPTISLSVGMIAVAFLMWSQMFGFKVKSQGQSPDRLLTKEYFECEQPCENIIISETISIQMKIDDLDMIKECVAYALRIALFIFLLTPLISLVLVGIVKMII